MITFNGVHLKQFVNKITDLRRDILPPREAALMELAGRWGAYLANTRYATRYIEADFVVSGPDMATIRQKLRALGEHLHTDSLVPLSFDDEPDKIYYGIFVGESNLSQKHLIVTGTLTFALPDPIAWSTTTNSVLVSGRYIRRRFDSVTSFNMGSHHGTIAETDESLGDIIRLTKTGTDYLGAVDVGWESGTHVGTQEVSDNYLQLAKSGTDYDFTWDTKEEWEDPSNTRNNTGSADEYDDLDLINLPEWNFMDEMGDYEENWRIQSPTAGGEVIQNDDYVTIKGTSVTSNFGLDTQQNPNITVRFPCTIYIRYRGRNSSNARFLIEDGTTYGYTYNFDDESNEWVHYWIRATTTEATVYKNGIQVATIPVRGGGAANQLQFDIQSGGSGDYDIGAVFIDWNFDKGPPPADGWWEGTWETSWIDLSQVGIIEEANIEWEYWIARPFNPFNSEDDEDGIIDFQDVRIEYQLRINGVEQGWVTIFDNPSNVGTGNALIPDLPSGTSAQNTEVKLRITLKTCDPSGWPFFEYLRLYVKSSYYKDGFRISPNITAHQSVVNAHRTLISWATNSVPVGTKVTVSTRLFYASDLLIDDMEVDNDKDGIVDGWTATQSGSPLYSTLYDKTEKAQKISVIASDAPGYVYLSRVVDVTPGQPYTLSADVKAANVTGTFAGRLTVTYRDSEGTAIATDFVTFTNTSWQRLALQGTTPPTGAVTAAIKIEAYITSAGDTGDVWFRKVYFHQGSLAKTYPDWQTCTNGDEIPGIDQGTDLTNSIFQYRVDLSTNDGSITPSVDRLDYQFFSGYRAVSDWVSPVISLAPANVIGESSISWTWDGVETLTVKARVCDATMIDIDDMAWDSNNDGTVDGFNKSDSDNATEFFTFDPVEKAQKIDVQASTTVAHSNVNKIFPVTPGKTYTASVLTKAANPSDTNFRPRILYEWLDTNMSPVGHHEGSDWHQGSSYRRIYNTATVPDGVAYVKVRCEAYVNAAGSTGVAWFKEFMFYEGSDQKPYPQWQTINNGDPIPGVQGQQGKATQVMLTLSTTDTSITPKVTSLEILAREEDIDVITYQGSAPGYPKFTVNILDNGVTQLKILHLESGEYIQIDHSFNQGDVVEIDHRDYSVKLNGIHRLEYVNIGSRFFQLRYGKNSFQVTPDSGVEVTMEWIERWK